MKTWHLFLLIMVTAVINLLTIYNIAIAYITFFFLLQIGLPRIILLIEKYTAKSEREKSHPVTKFILAYLHHRFIRSINYISQLISLTVLVFSSIIFSIIQVFFKQEIANFIKQSFLVNVNMILDIGSYIGYGLFLIALIIVLIDSIQILKNEPIFRI